MRKDGIRLKNIDPMYTVAAHIMNKRYDAMNMTTIDIPVEPMQKFLNGHRKAGNKISHLALIITAYLRTVADFPELNRFFVNKTPYARNEFCVAMVVLKAGEEYGHGTISKLYLDFNDTIFDVNDKINKFVEENRYAPDNNGTEKMIKILLGIPGFLRFGVSFAKWLDKHGLLPKKVIDMSPFHNSLLISNLASIRTDAIYHHIYELGTTSICFTMGKSHDVPKRDGENIVLEKCMPIGVVMDERIASGTYFAMAFRRLSGILRNPKELETPPKQVKVDPALVKK